ncbi:hypothetical protein CLOP_g15272 [Closterium sp. NIES-67]|nr:hypothetical protein CLOP_g15272 [Closterium sp. NIES-67]
MQAQEDSSWMGKGSIYGTGSRIVSSSSSSKQLEEQQEEEKRRRRGRKRRSGHHQQHHNSSRRCQSRRCQSMRCRHITRCMSTWACSQPLRFHHQPQQQQQAVRATL